MLPAFLLRVSVPGLPYSRYEIEDDGLYWRSNTGTVFQTRCTQLTFLNAEKQVLIGPGYNKFIRFLKGGRYIALQSD